METLLFPILGGSRQRSSGGLSPSPLCPPQERGRGLLRWLPTEAGGTSIASSVREPGQNKIS